MPYTREIEKEYEFKLSEVSCAVEGAVAGLGGKILSKDDDKHYFEVKFDKKILGKVLGDRSQMEITLSEENGKTKVAVTAYPVDVVGRKMTFGARKGVLSTVLHWFFAHLEHRLGVPAANPQ